MADIQPITGVGTIIGQAFSFTAAVFLRARWSMLALCALASHCISLCISVISSNNGNFLGIQFQSIQSHFYAAHTHMFAHDCHLRQGRPLNWKHILHIIL